MSEIVSLGDHPLVQGPRSFVADWMRPVLGAAEQFSACDLRDAVRTEKVIRGLLGRDSNSELLLVDIWGGVGARGAAYEESTRPGGARPLLLPGAQRVYTERTEIPGHVGGYATDVFPVDSGSVPDVVELLRTEDYGRKRILLHVPKPTRGWSLLRIMQMLAFASKEFAVDQYSPVRGAFLADQSCWNPLMRAFVHAATRWGIVPYVGLADHDAMRYILVPGAYPDLDPHLLDIEADDGLVRWMTRYVYETGAGSLVFVERDDV